MNYLSNYFVLFKGPVWKRDRKLIQPILNMKFMTDSLDIFEKHTNTFIDILRMKCDGKTFDILHLLHDCYGDIVTGR